MLHYNEIRKHPKVLKSMTSLNEGEFNLLCLTFEKAWSESIKPGDSATGGRPPKLSTIEDKLLFILFYLKTYCLQEVLGYLFDMTQSQANEWIYRLTEVLQSSLQKLGFLPARTSSKFNQLLNKTSSHCLALDGTEKRIQRPEDKRDQKAYYSGKKKTHTVKNDIIIDLSDRNIKYLTKTCEGKKSEISIIEEEKTEYPEGIGLFQDKGFQGYKPEGVNVFQPTKKPQGKELTEEQKDENRLISKVRVVVEHVISGIKRLRIVKDVYRNFIKGYDDIVILVSCGLHNFRTYCRKNIVY